MHAREQSRRNETNAARVFLVAIPVGEAADVFANMGFGEYICTCMCAYIYIPGQQTGDTQQG